MLNPILNQQPTNEQFNTALQREYLTSMAHAAKQNIELAYRSLAYLKEQAFMIKSFNPAAELDRRSMQVAMAEIEASRELLRGIVQLFGIDVVEGDR